MRKFAVALCVVLAATACGGGGGTGDDTEPTADATETEPETAASEAEEPADEGEGDQEVLSLKVGVIPIIDTAPIYMARDNGIFESHGLEVELVEGQAGAAAVAAITSGELDFGFAAPVPEIQAQGQGLDLVVVANAYSQGEELSQAVVTTADNPAESIRDLGGMTIAGNALQAVNELVVRAAYQEAGGDPSELEFIALPYPDMQAALESGSIDAAFLIEPFLSRAIGSGNFKAVSENPQIELVGVGSSLSSYFTSQAYIDANPEAVDRFVAAMAEANEFADANPDEVRAAIPTFTAIAAEVAEGIAIGQYLPEVDDAVYEVFGRYMTEYGWIPAEPDLSTLLYRP
ncbi:MAG: ABC transporter substrate-binding protein [Actinobacteria bacterium]|nr:ABC transporter substrate-binding protein [Actinomycetota bacterium]